MIPVRTAAASFLCPLIMLASHEWSGAWVGTWSSTSSGGAGDIKVSLTADSAGKPQAVSSFTYGGQEVKTTSISCSLAGSGLQIVIEYDLDGRHMRTRLDGTVSGKTIEGNYMSIESPEGQPLDEGTWQATRN